MRILLPLLFTLVAGCASDPDDVVQLATQASSLKSEYPALSKRLGEQGRVDMRVHVLANGDAGEVELRQSSGHARLDAAAVAAVKKFKFNPSRTRSGRAVDSWMNVPITYVLEGPMAPKGGLP